MNLGKVASNADRQTRKRWYARINWNAHVVPLVQEAVEAFGKEPWAKGHCPPHVSLLSDTIRPHEMPADPAAQLGDAISIQFGVRPGLADAAVPPGFSRPLLSAERAGLVFCQATSGAVSVFIYPPGAAATPRYYLVARYRDPADLTRSHIRRHLHDLFDLDVCFTRHSASSVAYGKQLLLLQDRAEAMQAGSADIVAHLQRLTHLMRGLAKLYRASRASAKGASHAHLVWLSAYGACRTPRPPKFGRHTEPLRAAMR